MFAHNKKHPRFHRFVFAAGSAVGLNLVSAVLGTTTASWAAPLDGTWTNPANWTTDPVYPDNFQPGPGDLYDAVINASTGVGYAVTLNSDITINSLTIASPDVTFAQQTGTTLRLVDGGLTINAGTYLLGTATLSSTDAVTIKSRFIWNGGTLTGSGAFNVMPGALMSLASSAHSLRTTLNNAGVMNIATTDQNSSNGTLNNLAGGVINVTTPAQFNGGSLGNLFNNAGLFNVDVGNGAGTFAFRVPLVNTGTINVASGSVIFDTSSSYTHNGGFFTGPGTVDLGGQGVNQILAGNLTISASNVSLNGATISGVGNLQVNSVLNWNSGTMTGAGATNIAHNAALNIGTTSGSRWLSRTLNNSGVVNITTTGLTISSGTLNNNVDGVINIGSVSAPINVQTGSSTLINNSGIVNLNNGFVTLPPMISSGTINVAAGASGAFGFNTSTFETGASMVGPGSIEFGGGTYTVNGTLTLAGSNMRFSSGVFQGPGDINLTNALNWTGGTIGLTGSSTLATGAMNILPGAGMSVTTGGTHILARTLNNSGTISLASGTITFNNGTLNNLAGGVINIAPAGSFATSFGTLSLIRNSGVINVDSGVGSVTLLNSPAIVNSATINVNNGRLILGSGTQNTGAFIGGAGSIDLTAESSTQTLNGTLTVSGNNINNGAGTITGAGNLAIRGTYNWGSGAIAGAGIVDINSTSMMNITGVTHTLSRTINNAGTINYSSNSSSSSINLANGTINNLAGGVINLNVGTGTFLSPAAGSLSLLSNAGQINNSGTVNLIPGFGYGSTFVDSGTINAVGGFLFLHGGHYTTGATITGPGFVSLATNFGELLTLDDTLTLGGTNVNMSGGALTGSGDLAVTGVFACTGGSFSGTGQVMIASGAAFNVGSTTGGSQLQTSRVINNAGTLNILATGGLLMNGGTLNNLASGVINVGNNSNPFSGGAINNLVTNAGLIKFSPTGGVTLAVPLVNSGTLNFVSGSATLTTTTFNAGAFVTGPGFVELGGGTQQTVNGSLTLAGSKMQLMGTLTGPGNITLTGSLAWNSGTIAGAGLLSIVPGATINFPIFSTSHNLGRVLNNNGVIGGTQAGFSLDLAGGTINNLAGGVINCGTFVTSFFPFGSGINRFTNAGTINLPRGQLQISVPFSNTGTLEIGAAGAATATLTTGASQIVGPVLTHGTWIVHTSSFLSLDSASISFNQGNVILDGVGSNFPAINPLANNSGTFQLTGGRSFVTSASYTNAGRTVVGPSSSLVVTGDLSNTGTIDMGGAMVVDTFANAPPSAIVAQIVSGFAGGAWNGPGISSTRAAAVAADGANPNKSGVGYALASDIGIVGSGTFAGLSVPDTALLVRYTLLGDANLDGSVNGMDFNAFVSHMGLTNQPWSHADFNYDGIVNTLDFAALSSNFGYTVPAASPGPDLDIGALVPEPIGASLILCAPLLASRQRRRAFG